MAFVSDSTAAPARPLLPFVFRPAPPIDDPRSTDDLIEEIRRMVKGQEVSVQTAPKPEMPPEPLLPLADLAKTRHLRRQLAQAAEQGVALLAALGLPRLVDADFVPLDREVIGDALDLAIATLDAVDGDTDLEADEDDEDGHDREQDTADAELSCGWTAKISQIHLGAAQDDHETTALERHGKGFIRCGADDAEDDDREILNEDGSDWGEAQTPWWNRIGYPEMEVGTHV